MKPYVVKSVCDADGDIIRRGAPQVVGHPIAPQTSAVMRRLLEDVVTLGGGKNAFIPGYHVGGKTGTAQVYKDGVVSRDTHIGSFVGFAPANDPRIAVLLVVDEADVAVDFGSVTAAPFAREILEKSLPYLGVAPDTGETPAPGVTVPDVTGLGVDEARRALAEAGLDSVLDGAGGKVIRQLPVAGAQMSAGALVMLYVAGPAANGESVQVPDVVGMPVTEANRLIKSYGLEMEIDGCGLAVSQSPVAGTTVNPTTHVAVRFQPP
jgi:stage V sporulation protein D (sporulation-specific penicillin-binding protein)